MAHDRSPVGAACANLFRIVHATQGLVPALLGKHAGRAEYSNQLRKSLDESKPPRDMSRCSPGAACAGYWRAVLERHTHMAANPEHCFLLKAGLVLIDDGSRLGFAAFIHWVHQTEDV